MKGRVRWGGDGCGRASAPQPDDDDDDDDEADAAYSQLHLHAKLRRIVISYHHSHYLGSSCGVLHFNLFRIWNLNCQSQFDW